MGIQPTDNPVGTGVLDGPQIELTKYGQIADKYIHQLNDFYDDLSIEAYVIMPNHIHIMLWVKGNENGPSRTPENGPSGTVKSKIVNSCARGLYTHFMFSIYALGSRTERSAERLPKAARRSRQARNAAIE